MASNQVWAMAEYRNEYVYISEFNYIHFLTNIYFSYNNAWTHKYNNNNEMSVKKGERNRNENQFSHHKHTDIMFTLFDIWY